MYGIHQPCHEVVQVPTIKVKPFAPGGEDEIFVQWFGESDQVNLNGKQFYFPVCSSPDGVHWFGKPEEFKVVLMGQVKDWPKKEVIDRVAECTPSKSVEAWILWVTSSLYKKEYPSGEGPACFVTPLTAMLADQAHGVIMPRKYCDLSVLKQ